MALELSFEFFIQELKEREVRSAEDYLLHVGAQGLFRYIIHLHLPIQLENYRLSHK